MGGGGARWAAVPLRLVTGIILVVSAYGKLMNMGGNIANFTKWGFPIPAVTGTFIMLLELLGGIALLLGLFVRYFGALFTIEFIVAALWVKFPLAGYQPSRIDMMLFGAALALLFLGAGPLSIDSVWLEKGKK